MQDWIGQEAPKVTSEEMDRTVPPAAAMETAPASKMRIGDADVARLEQFLVRLWGEILKRENVRRDDNFFALGGRSLHAMMMINRLQDAIGISIPQTLIFEAQTVAELVAALAGEEDEVVL